MRNPGVVIALFFLWCLSMGGAIAEVNKFNWMWEENEALDSNAVVISRSGRYVVCGTMNYSNPPLRPNYGPGIYICLFERSSNMPAFYYDVDKPRSIVEAVACSYDAEIIGFTVQNWVYILDKTGTLLWKKNCANFYHDSIAISSDATFIAAATYSDDSGLTGPTLFYFSADSNQPLWSKLLGNGILLQGGVKMSEDGRYIVCATAQKNSKGPALFYFDSLASDPTQPLWTFANDTLSSNSYTFDISTDGAFIVFEANGKIHFFDNTIPPSGTKQPLWTEEGGGYSSTVHDIAISSNGSRVAYTGPHLILGLDEYIGTIELWNTSGTGTKLWQVDHYIDTPAVAISSNGTKIYYGGNVDLSYDPVIGLINQQGNTLWTYPAVGIPSVADDGEFAAVGVGVIVGYNYRNYYPLMLFQATLNQSPRCTFLSPIPGSTVSDIINVTGSASDTDGTIIGVVAGYYGKYYYAQDTSGQGTWSTWKIDLNVSDIPDGSIALRAESIDNQYKYSFPMEIEVTIRNSTPAATYTPSQSQTPTPNATPTLTPTSATGPGKVFELSLNGSLFVGGDILILVAESNNTTSSMLEVNQIVLLDIFGTYYFHPNWTQDLMYTERYLPPGNYYREPLLAVGLPEFLEPAGPFYFLGALFTQNTWDLIGDISSVAFIFQ